MWRVTPVWRPALPTSDLCGLDCREPDAVHKADLNAVGRPWRRVNRDCDATLLLAISTLNEMGWIDGSPTLFETEI